MEYRMLNPLIWELGPLPEMADPDPADYSPAECAAVLDHPAFVSWFWQAPPVYEAAGQLNRRPTLSERTATVSALLDKHFGDALVASYNRRLTAMARWLALAQQPQAAALAQQCGLHLYGMRPSEVPFLQRLASIGLDVAITNLRSGFDWRRHLGAPA
jgi:hypothetical protein